MKNIGIFGLGRQGSFLFEYLSKLANVKIDFISTLPQDYQNPLVKSTLATIQKSYNSLPKKVDPVHFLANPAKYAQNLDGFLVTSPTKHHLPILKALSPFKKIIFVQKPFAMTLSQAAQGWKQLNSDQTPCLVGFQRRFDPAHQALLKRVENQSIKSIRAVHSDNPRASIDYLKIAGSQPLDQGIHQLDFLSRLKRGETPQTVFAQGYSTIPELKEANVTDRCLIFIKYKDGSTFNLELRRDSVVGYQNDFVVETQKQQLSVLDKFEKRAGSGISPVYFNDYKERYLEAYYREVDYFVEFMDKPQRHTLTQEKEILSTMKVLQAIQQSLMGGKIIKIDN